MDKEIEQIWNDHRGGLVELADDVDGAPAGSRGILIGVSEDNTTFPFLVMVVPPTGEHGGDQDKQERFQKIATLRYKNSSPKIVYHDFDALPEKFRAWWIPKKDLVFVNSTRDIRELFPKDCPRCGKPAYQGTGLWQCSAKTCPWYKEWSW